MGRIKRHIKQAITIVSFAFIGALCFGQSPLSAQTLTLGTPVSGTLDTGEWHYYQVTGAAEVSLYDLSADLDLYIRDDATPTTSNFDCRPYSSGTENETCAITGSGTVYIGVRGYRAGSYSLLATASDSTGVASAGSAIFDTTSNTLESSCIENIGYPGNGLPAGFSLSSILQDAGYLAIDSGSMVVLEILPDGCEDYASFVIDAEGSIAQIEFHYPNVRVSGTDTVYSLALIATDPWILDQYPTDVREVRSAIAAYSVSSGSSTVQLSLPDDYVAGSAANSLLLETAAGVAVDYSVVGNTLTVSSDTAVVHDIVLRGVSGSVGAFVERFTVEITASGSSGGADTDSAGSNSSGVTGIAQHIEQAYLNGCVIVEGGQVKCWGISTVTGGVPTLVPGLSNVKKIAVGYYSACAITASDSVKCWGWERWGMLGNHSTGNERVENPVTVDLAGTVVDISVGLVHGCAVLSTGDVYCWGADLGGALGNGAAATPSDGGPTIVTGVSGATKVSSYSNTKTCALFGGGQISCWGSNVHTPSVVSGIATAIDILASNNYVCTILSDGTVKCWGEGDSYWQLGSASQSDSTTPVEVVGVSNAIALSVGLRHSCALISGGTIKCWGDNSSGQLGTGSTGDPSQAVTVVGVSDATQVATADSTTGYIDDALMVNLLGQASYPLIGTNQAPIDSTSPVQMSDEFSSSTDTGDTGDTGGSGDGGGSDYCELCGTWVHTYTSGREEFFTFTEGGTGGWRVDYHGEFGRGDCPRTISWVAGPVEYLNGADRLTITAPSSVCNPDYTPPLEVLYYTYSYISARTLMLNGVEFSRPGN